MSRAQTIIAVTALIAISAAYLYLTSGFDLVSGGEARAAEIAREMLARGNFILPSLNYEVSTETMTKPPFYHWLLIGSGVLFDWSNRAMHLPSALAALASLLLVYLLAARMFGRRAGVLACVVLASTLLFLSNASNTRIDVLFATLILAAFTALYYALDYAQDHARDYAGASEAPGKTVYWAYLAYVVMGLAVITKGPVGLLLPAIVLLIYLWWAGHWGQLKNLHPGRGLIIILIVALPWYLGVALTAAPELRQYFFFGQLAHWWSGGNAVMAGQASAKSALYYFPYLAFGMFPWSLFLPVALLIAIRDVWQGRQHREQPQIMLLLLWFIGGLVLFSLGGKKAARYLLPILPAAAVLMGYYLDRLIQARNTSPRHWGRYLPGIFSLLALSLLVALWGLFYWGVQHPEAALTKLVSGKNAGETEGITRAWEYLLAHQGAVFASLGLLVVIGMVALLGFARQRVILGSIATAMVAWLALFAVTLSVKPILVAHSSPRQAAETIRRQLPVKLPVYIGGDAYKHAFRWYLDRDLTLLPRAQHARHFAENPSDWHIFMTRKPLSIEYIGEQTGAQIPNRPPQQWQVDYYTITLFPPSTPGQPQGSPRAAPRSPSSPPGVDIQSGSSAVR
ncbi:MAG: hypothetical protein BMS9Abin26_1823 [Gammaproteobacteria bacterium]|nr:MAG: hypothetical protein BMS9Abin26_1823 [Gammaproteobacteria bacterium]